MQTQIAQGVESFNAAFGSIGTHLGMKCRSLVTDLAHVTQHQQAWGWQLGQHIDRRTHRIGVGVVGVIDQGDFASRGVQQQSPRPALDRFKSLQTLRHSRQWHASGQSASTCRQGIFDIVSTCDVQAHRGCAHRGFEGELPCTRLPDHHSRPNIGSPIAVAHGERVLCAGT